MNSHFGLFLKLSYCHVSLHILDNLSPISYPGISPESIEPDLSFATKLDRNSGLIVWYVSSQKGREVCQRTLYVAYNNASGAASGN